MQLRLYFLSWFLENFSGGGKMNKVHEKTIFTQNGLSIQKLWQETCYFCEEWAASFLPRHKGKKISFPIHAVNFCETFCTCSPSSLGQDLAIKNTFFFEEAALKSYTDSQALQAATSPVLVAFPKCLKYSGHNNPIAGNNHFAGFN
jgi:hypothetical protein